MTDYKYRDLVQAELVSDEGLQVTLAVWQWSSSKTTVIDIYSIARIPITYQYIPIVY